LFLCVSVAAAWLVAIPASGRVLFVSLFAERNNSVQMGCGVYCYDVSVVSVCGSVRAHISETTPSNFYQIFWCVLTMVVARSSSGGVIISYVFPVLQMTSGFLIMALGGVTLYTATASPQCVYGLILLLDGADCVLLSCLVGLHM